MPGIRLLVAVLVASTLFAWTPIDELLVRRVDVVNLRPEIGLAYIGALRDPTLSDHEKPSGALLYAIKAVKGTPLHRLETRLGGSYAFDWMLRFLDNAFPNATYEIRTSLGPGEALHADIRELGNGRYSIWRGLAFLSVPRGTVMPGRFVVVVPDAASLRRAARIIAISAAALLLAYGIGRAIKSTWIGRNVVPGLVVSAVMFALIGVGAEVYFRLTVPFLVAQNYLPYRFDPVIGHIIAPGQPSRWTNGITFWGQGKANSIGFLDHEPTIPKPAGTFRILIVGDSMIEAAQVNLEQKVQTLLAEKLARGGLGLKTDVVALGISGTGQSSQLSFYEGLGKVLQPDLVILLFVENDFANNSVLLESIRHSWNPEHPPRLYFEPIPGTTEFRRVDIDPTWEQHRPPIAGAATHAKYFRGQERYAPLLQGWDPDGIDMDFAFFLEKLPAQVFHNAVASAGHALDLWCALAKRDQFKLLMVANDGHPLQSTEHRARYMGRVSTLVRSREIPLLDLRPEFMKRGDQNAAHIKYDGHWTPTGHRWAAEAIYEWLVRGGYLQSAKSSPCTIH